MSYPTFLINMEHQRQRRAFMETQFAALGIPLTRLEAARGADPAVRAAAEVAFFARMTDGEVGCFESHRRFWSRVVAEDLPGAYVIEDDVVIASDFATWAFPEAVLAAADVIKIDTGIENEAQYGATRIPLEGARSLVRLLGTEFSTGCYFVTQAGARKLLSLSKGYFSPVDIFMFDQDSKAFWALNIWKLDAAAAAQYRVYRPEIEEAETNEINDRISASRAPELNVIQRMAFRFRRLRDWDMRGERARRRQRGLDMMSRSEGIETRVIGFESPDHAHIIAAEVHVA